jgi:hypothetical protein
MSRTSASRKNCPVCDSKQSSLILLAPLDQPLARYGILDSKNEAVNAPRHKLEIRKCQKCRTIYNAMFDISAIAYNSGAVMESTIFSKGIKDHNCKMALKLHEKLALECKQVVEIGCGEGFFLSLFNNSQTIGFEPSNEYCNSAYTVDKFLNQYYDPREVYDFISPSLIILRQVLEHLESPRLFLDSFRNLLTKSKHKGSLYIEVPNSVPSLSSLRCEDFYYDHHVFYTISTLSRLLEMSGFRINEIKEELGGEIISALCTPEDIGSECGLQSKLKRSKASIMQMKLEGKKIVGWGAAGNGASFLNLLEINTSLIEYVVDSDVRKQNKYIPGTAQLIVPPNYLLEYRPDVILVFSQFHKSDIIKTAKSIVGCQVAFVTPEDL